MPDRERRKHEREGPSTEPVDQGLEGAIFDDERGSREMDADLRALDAAATGKRGIAASRTGEAREQEEPGGRNQESGNDSGEETPPAINPS